MFDKIDRYDSSNKNVSKFIFTKDDAIAEAVLYKYPTYEERTVICCSTQSGCKVGCRFCFLPGTLVKTTNGSKPIEDITIDDIVFGPTQKNEVNSVFRRDYNGEVVEIELENGEIIIVTADHEMLYENGEIVLAKNLQINENLMDK